MVLRHSPLETEKCKLATWRMWNFPSLEKCRGGVRGDLTDCLGAVLAAIMYRDICLTLWRKVIHILCHLFLISGMVGGNNFLKPYQGMSSPYVTSSSMIRSYDSK